MTRFWRNWLTVWCWAVGLFGVVLIGGAFEATSGPTRMLFGVLNPDAPPLVPDEPMRFSLAVLGAVTLGWSITLHAAIEAAEMLGARGEPIWRLVTLSVVVWYVVDSALSVATGYGLNVAPNTLFLATYLLPALRGRRAPQPREAM